MEYVFYFPERTVLMSILNYVFRDPERRGKMTRRNLVLSVIALAAVALSVTTYAFTSISSEDVNVTRLSDVSVSFAQYGGLMPLDMARQELTVHTNGILTLVWKDREGEVTSAYRLDTSRDEVSDLMRFLADNGVYELDARYTTPEGVAVMDAGVAEITVTAGDAVKTVIIDPNVGEYLPQNLRNIVSELRKLTEKTVSQGVQTVLGKVGTEGSDPVYVSWDEAVRIIHSGEVESVFMTHSLDVQLFLKDGRTIRTTEPTINDLFDELDRCGDPCKDIIRVTE